MKKIPHTYVIIFSIIIFAAILTWIIPGGAYIKKNITKNGKQTQIIIYEQVNKDGKIQKIPKFKYLDNNPQTWQIFAALFDGFKRQAAIIVFILIVGGAFWIINSTKAIDFAIISFLKFIQNLEKYKFLKFLGVENIVLITIMLIFSTFGAVFGMSEETIAFIVIMVPLAISMGYDSITGVAMVFVAAGLGFAGAILNPFTIGIAQSIAGLPLFSGIQYRFVAWIIINFVGIAYIIRYANKIKKNPQKSPTYHLDNKIWKNNSQTNLQNNNSEKKNSFGAFFAYLFISIALIIFSFYYPKTTITIAKNSINLPFIPILTALFIFTGFITVRRSSQFFIINMLIFTIIFLIIGVMGYKWYMKEISTLFFALGILAGISAGYNPNKIASEFINGMKDILSAAAVVGLAGGIIVILQNGNIIDTLLYKMSNAMQGTSKIITVQIMYIIQTILNIIIPSGSAKAAITMPIMAPFSEYINLSKQATVMAYQFGDGFTNLITPTSGVLIGVLEMAKIPYHIWFKWILPLIIILTILGALLLIPTVILPLNGF